MLPIVLNAHADKLQPYDRLNRLMEQRYGATSQAMALALYEELIFVRQLLLEHQGDAYLQARVAALRTQIQALYDTDTFPPSRRFPLRYVSADPIVIEYPRDIFEERYGAVADQVRADTRILTGPDLQGLATGVPYMFVVDDRRQLRVWDRRFRFQDLLFGRNRATVNGVPVAHPTLVPEQLRVMAAGEIVFIGEPRPSAVVANTKSGHFWPPPSSASVIRTLLRDIFGLGPRDIDLFVLALAPDAEATRSDARAR